MQLNIKPMVEGKTHIQCPEAPSSRSSMRKEATDLLHQSNIYDLNISATTLRGTVPSSCIRQWRWLLIIYSFDAQIQGMYHRILICTLGASRLALTARRFLGIAHETFQFTLPATFWCSQTSTYHQRSSHCLATRVVIAYPTSDLSSICDHKGEVIRILKKKVQLLSYSSVSDAMRCQLS